jgi:hypothetical protein
MGSIIPALRLRIFGQPTQDRHVELTADDRDKAIELAVGDMQTSSQVVSHALG